MSAVLTAMGDAIRHLAHQVVTTHPLAPSVGIGRLHIGIFNTEPQPVTSSDEQIQLCLTGEFYHQDERRRNLASDGQLAPGASDAELALAVYQTDGAHGLTTLEGAFLIAVWDGHDQQLVLVNDRYGLFPHYYSQSGAAFSFAPEIKGVLAVPGVGRTMNLTAVAEYVRFQQLLGDKTWLEGIELLQPASLLSYEPARRRLRIERYWDWDQIGTLPEISFDDAAEETGRLFQRAVDEMSRPPYRVGVYLSGGLDSRTILSFLGDRGAVTTLTYGQRGCRDVVYAAELARRSGSDHHWFPFQDGQWVLDYAPLHLALTEGMHSWLHMHGISTLETARQLIDVNLSGWEGSVFRNWMIMDLHAELAQRGIAATDLDIVQGLFTNFCYNFTWPGMTEAEAASLDRGTGELPLSRAFESLNTEYGLTDHIQPVRRDYAFWFQQAARRSLQNMIVFARASIEVRCPLVDYSFLEWLYTIPDRHRTRFRLQRAIITGRAPSLSWVPRDTDDSLPHANPVIAGLSGGYHRSRSIFNRRIYPLFRERPQLYADYEEYLRTDLREWAEDLLFNPRTRERGLFNPDAVRSLWDRHLSGRELWTVGKVAPLIEIERVHRHLIDGDHLREA